MLKNAIITILTILVVLFWLGADSADAEYDDPDSIILEYKCSTLDEYENVPPEVIQECRNRLQVLTRNTV